MTVYWMILNPNETQTMIIEVEDSRIEGSVGCKFDSVTIYQGTYKCMKCTTCSRSRYYGKYISGK